MTYFRRLLLTIFLLPLHALASVNPDWTAALGPFRIADDLYYVGSRDLAVYLVTTPAGNILINANLASSPAQIRASVEQLGFHWADTRVLLNSQAHFDHVAGAAQVLRETHARNMVMAGDAEAMASGGRKDFAYKSDGILVYPAAHVDRVLQDGETVTLGGVTLIAHKTAGHTRGCTTWTMRVHLPGEPAGVLRDVVIVGGVSALSQYALAGHVSKAHPVTYPGIVEDFRATFVTLRKLPCDVFLGAHGLYFDMLPKLARGRQGGASVWLDAPGYRRFVDGAERSFEANVAQQKSEAGY